MPVAIISTCSKTRMECDIKVSLCKNLHLFSYFLKPSSHNWWEVDIFPHLAAKIAKNVKICPFYPIFAASCCLARAVSIQNFSTKYNYETFFRELRRSEEHTSELQSPDHLVCRLLLEKKKSKTQIVHLVIVFSLKSLF